MNESMKRFEQLSQKARLDHPDFAEAMYHRVKSRVLEDIATKTEASDFGLAFIGIGSASVAVLTLIYMIPLFSLFSDPIWTMYFGKAVSAFGAY